MSAPFREKDLILFTGDSITDCGRNRNDPGSLRMGYAASCYNGPAVERMRADLDPKSEIINNLAGEFGAIWVDFDAGLMAAQRRHIPSYWAEDGVRPSIAGHALMAETWLGMVGE